MSNPTSSAAKETSWLRWLPGLATLRSYESAWLTHDLVAGIVLTTMLAPVGIAYAVASGVGPIYGLYATIACLLAYALFGPSRILVLGPDSSLAAVILGVIAPLSVGDPQLAIARCGSPPDSGATTPNITAASEESGPSTKIRLGPKSA